MGVESLVRNAKEICRSFCNPKHHRCIEACSRWQGMEKLETVSARDPPERATVLDTNRDIANHQRSNRPMEGNR